MRVRCGMAGLRERVLLTVGGCDFVVDVGVFLCHVRVRGRHVHEDGNLPHIWIRPADVAP